MSLLAAISFFEEAGNEELLGQASEMLEYVHEAMRFGEEGVLSCDDR